MAFVNCENITLSYEGRDVISGLTFHLEKGEYLCIVGENGSGKSTLIKGILGFVKPTEGKIFLKALRRMKSAICLSRPNARGISRLPSGKLSYRAV